MALVINYRNHDKILYGFVGLGLLLGGIGLSGIFDSKSSSKTPAVSAETPAEVLYLPSPLESELLGPGYKIWPGIFGPEAPLVPERVPELYSAALRGERAVGWSDQDLAVARRWSIALNSHNLPRLKSMLSEVVPDPQAYFQKKGRTRPGCTLPEQEALFRWMQLQSITAENFLSYLEECKVGGVLKDWIQLRFALEHRRESVAAHALQRLKLRSMVPDKSWNRWFAEKALKYAALASRGSNDETPTEESPPQE